MKTEKIFISAGALSGGATNPIGCTHWGDAARTARPPVSWSQEGWNELSCTGGFLKLDPADVRQGTWLMEHRNHG